MAITDDLPKAWRPPMGWNSWDSYGTTVTEREVLANARFIADHLKDAGWDTLGHRCGLVRPQRPRARLFRRQFAVHRWVRSPDSR